MEVSCPSRWKHSEDGEGKCVLLLTSVIMSVSLQIPLYSIKWANPQKKHGITLYSQYGIYWMVK